MAIKTRVECEWNVETMTPEQKRIYEAASPEFLAGLGRVQKLMSKNISSNVWNAYNLGREIDVLQKACGDRTLSRLQVYFVMGQDTLSVGLMIYQRFTEDELTNLLARRCADGSPIYWAHVRVLARIADASARNLVIERLLAESWKTKELNDFVQKSGEDAVAPGRGRHVAKPHDLAGCVTQIIKKSQYWQNHYTQVWSHLQDEYLGEIGQMNAVEKRQLLDKISSAISVVDQIEQISSALTRDLPRLRAKIEELSGHRKDPAIKG